MKVHSCLGMIVFLHGLCLLPPSEAGYLEDAWVRFNLAHLGQSSEAALQPYLEMQLLLYPQQERSRITGYLKGPESEEAIRWAHDTLVPGATAALHLGIAAWIIKMNECPEKTVYEVLSDYGIQEQRALARGIDRIEAASYPVIVLHQEHQPIIEKGLRDELLPEEANQLKELLTSLLGKDLPGDEEQYKLFYCGSLAYVHATGDPDYIQQLWQSSSEPLERLAFEMGVFSTNETIVIKILDLIQPLKDSGEIPRSVRDLFIGFLRAHKSMSCIGRETRDWFERTTGKLEQDPVRRLSLIKLMGEDGWCRNDQLMNQSLLHRFVWLEEIHLKAAQESLLQIEKHLQSPASTQQVREDNCSSCD